MAKTALERQFSTASEDFEDEMLDPRVQVGSHTRLEL